jgi:hypothetical protein
MACLVCRKLINFLKMFSELRMRPQGTTAGTIVTPFRLCSVTGVCKTPCILGRCEDAGYRVTYFSLGRLNKAVLQSDT